MNTMLQMLTAWGAILSLMLGLRCYYDRRLVRAKHNGLHTVGIEMATRKVA